MALRTVEICCDYRDLRTRAKVERLVSAFAQTIEPDGKIFGDPQITGGAAYLYDKLVCGLMDAHQFADQRKALDALTHTTKSVLRHLPGGR